MAFDLSPQSCKARCATCPTASACVIRGAVRADVERWSTGVESQVALPVAGKALLEAGAPVQAIYSVRAGCLKSFTVDEDGNERVRGFHLPGDVIGLDALGAASHPATVVAVTPAQVCRIPISQVRRVMTDSPALAQQLFDRISGELAQALALAGDYTAEQRMAAFLLSMEYRLGAGRDGVKLPMTRRDIANYLRLATETVCRVLTRFENQGRIRSQSKTVRLVDTLALRALAQPMSMHRAAA
jgi:CRP/FNR family transcriptional regulator, anaerobic regulatory protein